MKLISSGFTDRVHYQSASLISSKKMISPQLTPHRAPWFWWNLPASPTSATSGSRGWWCSSWWACRWCGGGGAGWAARPPRTSPTPPPSYLHCPAERFWWVYLHCGLFDVHCTLAWTTLLLLRVRKVDGGEQKKKSHLEKLLLQLSTELLHWWPGQANMRSDLLFRSENSLGKIF